MASNIGDNVQLDFAAEESGRLAQEYGYLAATADALLNEAAAIEVLDDPETKVTVMGLIKKLRDHSKTVLGMHEIEKLPHYRRGQAVDQFFFGLADKLAKRDRKNRDGGADRLQRLLTDYDQRVLAAEQERRRRELEEQERVRRAAEAARRKAEQEAEEARLRAERARTEATKAAKDAEARRLEEEASAKRVAAQIAAAKEEEAYVETLAKPADLMRTRTEDGTLGTVGTENFAEVTNRSQIDYAKLGPYFTMDAVEKALNAYARANGYSSDASVQISGATFGKRPKSRVR